MAGLSVRGAGIACCVEPLHVPRDKLVRFGLDALVDLELFDLRHAAHLLLHYSVRELARQMLEVVGVGDARPLALLAQVRLKHLDH